MSGQILGLVIASTTSGVVLYERWFLESSLFVRSETKQRLTELWQTGRGPDAENVGYIEDLFAGGSAPLPVVFSSLSSELAMFLIGNGYYGEQALCLAERALSDILKKVTREQVVLEAVFIKHSGKLALAIDEVLGTGRMRQTDAEAIKRAYNLERKKG